MSKMTARAAFAESPASGGGGDGDGGLGGSGLRTHARGRGGERSAPVRALVLLRGVRAACCYCVLLRCACADGRGVDRDGRRATGRVRHHDGQRHGVVPARRSVVRGLSVQDHAAPRRLGEPLFGITYQGQALGPGDGQWTS